MQTGFKVILALAVIVASFAVDAQQPKLKELNNVEIQSEHPFAGTLVSRFEDGILNYTFTEGRRAGAGGVDLDYSARAVGEDLYLVSWHDEVNGNHITVLYDLKNRREYTEALMAYGDESRQVFSADSVIEKVTPIE